MATFNSLSRKSAANFIDEIIEAAHNAQTKEGTVSAEFILETVKRLGLLLPEKCCGQAHDPDVAGQIDNCGLCAPHWGVVFPQVKIR